MNFSEGNTFCLWILNHTTNFFVGSSWRCIWLTCATCCRLSNNKMLDDQHMRYSQGNLTYWTCLVWAWLEFRSCSVSYFSVSMNICVCVHVCKTCGVYFLQKKLYTTETHSDLLQQVQDGYLVKISEISTEQLKIIGTKYYLYWQSKLEMCDMHTCCSRKIGLMMYLFMLFY